MALTPEGRVKKVVVKLLREYEAYWFCPVQNGMGKPGLDFHCCHHGVAFFIETKAAGKRPTARQAICIRDIQRADGIVFVIDGTDDTDTYEVLEEFLKGWMP